MNSSNKTDENAPKAGLHCLFITTNWELHVPKLPTETFSSLSHGPRCPSPPPQLMVLPVFSSTICRTPQGPHSRKAGRDVRLQRELPDELQLQVIAVLFLFPFFLASVLSLTGKLTNLHTRILCFDNQHFLSRGNTA